MFDTDGNGEIDKKELEAAMKRMDFKYKAEEFKKIFDMAD